MLQRHFENVKELGRGGFGTVCLARKKYEHRTKKDPVYYAMKIVPFTSSSIAGDVQEPDFLLKHKSCPRIVHFYFTYVSSDSKLYICMEYCHYNLKTFLEMPENTSNIQLMIRLFLQCCEGLQYLHSRNIVHRDMKLANILIDARLDVKICDFGISKKLDATMLSTFCGTGFYMSPEVCKGQYSFSADNWSLCASFHHHLKGEAPYFNNKKEGDYGILEHKIACTNYNELTPKECSDADFRDIINNVLSNKPDKRLELDEIIDMLTISSEYKSNYKAKSDAIEQLNDSDNWDKDPNLDDKDLPKDGKDFESEFDNPTNRVKQEIVKRGETQLEYMEYDKTNENSESKNADVFDLMRNTNELLFEIKDEIGRGLSGVVCLQKMEPLQQVIKMVLQQFQKCCQSKTKVIPRLLEINLRIQKRQQSCDQKIYRKKDQQN